MLSLFFQFLMTLGSSSYLSLSIFYPQYLLGCAPSVFLFPLSLEINFVVSCAEKIKTDLEYLPDLGCYLFFHFQTFVLERAQPSLSGLTFPTDLSVMAALDRVLRLPSVASKRYLTNKVSQFNIYSS